MSVILQLLLAILPQLLKWLLSLKTAGKALADRQLTQMNQITWYAAQVHAIAPELGCAPNGWKPIVPRTAERADQPLAMGAEATDLTATVGPLMDSAVGDWLLQLVLELFRRNGKELALKLLKDFLLPWFKQQAATTPNKYDDYAVKQMERIVGDPEFIALLEGIG